MANVGDPVGIKQPWLAGSAQMVRRASNDSRAHADSENQGRNSVDQEIDRKPLGVDTGGHGQRDGHLHGGGSCGKSADINPII